MNFELLKELLIISMTVSVICTAFMQKVKELFLIKENIKSCELIAISFITSLIIGTFFALTFGHTNFCEAIWVGLFTFVGADSIYKLLEDKVFTSFKNLQSNKKE